MKTLLGGKGLFSLTYGDVVLLASAANLHGHGQKNQHVLNCHEASLKMLT